MSIYTELLGIVRKTIGVAEPLRLALEPFSEQLYWALYEGYKSNHASAETSLLAMAAAHSTLRLTD